MKPESGPPIRLAWRTLAHKRHVCAFFNSREEQNKVIIPFLREGLARGEKVLRIVHPDHREAYLAEYKAGGMDVEVAEKNGQLDVRHWHETYFTNGHFDVDSMLALLQEGLEKNRETYGLTRAVGNMEWALEPAPGVTDLIEYESRLNQIVEDCPDPLVCVYDLNKHSASVVIDILRTHPMVIVGGVLQENPLYVPPEEFLEELKQRKSEREATSVTAAAPHVH